MVEILSALFFVIIMVQIITKYDIMRNKQIRSCGGDKDG